MKIIPRNIGQCYQDMMPENPDGSDPAVQHVPLQLKGKTAADERMIKFPGPDAVSVDSPACNTHQIPQFRAVQVLAALPTIQVPATAGIGAPSITLFAAGTTS